MCYFDFTGFGNWRHSGTNPLDKYLKPPPNYDYSLKSPVKDGWICPICKKGKAPFITECGCKDKKES